MKKVYQTDENGFFVGEAFADESPLEPGVFLIPWGCVEEPPPAATSKKVARWNGSEWELCKIPAQPKDVTNESTEEQEVVKDAEAELLAEVQTFLDNSARSLGYDDIITAISYAEEAAVPKFQREGKQLRAWRSLVWQTFYAILDEVGGDVENIKFENVVERLPFLDFPDNSCEENIE